MRRRTHPRIYMHAHKHVHDAFMCACFHSQTHRNRHTYVHTHPHTPIRVCMYLSTQRSAQHALSPIAGAMPKTSPLGHAKRIWSGANSPDSFQLVNGKGKAESMKAETASDSDSDTVDHADNSTDTNPDVDIHVHKCHNDIRMGLSVPAFGYKITPKMLSKMLRMLGHIRHTHNNSAGDCMCVRLCAHVHIRTCTLVRIENACPNHDAKPSPALNLNLV